MDISFIVGETPLLIAVKKNDEIMIKFLLDLGAHPDVTDFKVFFRIEMKRTRIDSRKANFSLVSNTINSCG